MAPKTSSSAPNGSCMPTKSPPPRRAMESKNVAAAWQSLNACRADFRGWEYNYLYSLFTQNQRTLRGPGESCWSVAFSPDGTRLASAGLGVTVWDSASGPTAHYARGQDFLRCGL